MTNKTEGFGNGMIAFFKWLLFDALARQSADWLDGVAILTWVAILVLIGVAGGLGFEVFGPSFVILLAIAVYPMAYQKYKKEYKDEESLSADTEANDNRS